MIRTKRLNLKEMIKDLQTCKSLSGRCGQNLPRFLVTTSLSLNKEAVQQILGVGNNRSNLKSTISCR